MRNIQEERLLKNTMKHDIMIRSNHTEHQNRKNRSVTELFSDII